MFEAWAAAAAVGAVGAIAGGAIAASGARSAAETQANAANNAQQISLQEFNTITGQETPYMQSGYGALSALDYGLGISPQTATGAPVTVDPTSQAPSSQTPSGGSSPVAPFGNGGIAGPNGLYAGLHTAAPSAHTSLTGGTGVDPSSGFAIGPGGSISQLIPSPGTMTATQGLPASGMPGTAPPPGLGFGSLTTPFTTDNWKQLSPAYNFQTQQGQQNVLNSDAAGAGALSGAAQKDLINFNQANANQSFNNAFNQYQTQQGNIFSRLSGIAQLGQSAAANTGQQGTALAGQAAQSATNVGSALAAGQVGSANAWSGAINNAAPWLAYGGGGGTGSITNTTASDGTPIFVG